MLELFYPKPAVPRPNRRKRRRVLLSKSVEMAVTTKCNRSILDAVVFTLQRQCRSLLISIVRRTNGQVGTPRSPIALICIRFLSANV